MWTYILQTIVFQLVFLGAYELFLKRETFFTYNRTYLLITPVLAMVVPFLEIPVLQTVLPSETFFVLPEVLIGTNSEAGVQENLVPVNSTAQTTNWWLPLYASGFLINLGIFIKKIKALKQLFAHNQVEIMADIKIVEVPDSTIACTFYDTIFLGASLSEKEREQILSHEIVHVNQRHTLDLLFFELLRILFWFNPLIYIFQSRISAQHEYLADAGVVKNFGKQVYIQQLLNSVFNTQDISFINPFSNQSIIKKRIVMLQKSRSKTFLKLKFLIILPIMLGMLAYVSCSEDNVDFQEEREVTAQEKLEQIKAITNNGTDLTPEDQEQINTILKTMDSKELGKLRDSSEKVAQKKKGSSSQSDIPFAVVEEVPVFPGCDNLHSNEERKRCMSQKINGFINSHFDTTLGKTLDLKGIFRTYVQFKIDKEGIVEVLGARAPHPAIKKEAVRVVNLLPKMAPGKQNGEEVGVLYSLPITLKLGE